MIHQHIKLTLSPLSSLIDVSCISLFQRRLIIQVIAGHYLIIQHRHMPRTIVSNNRHSSKQCPGSSTARSLVAPFANSHEASLRGSLGS
jgi:hypothetical protein